MNPFTSPSSLSTSTNTGMSTRASGTYTLANQFPSEFRIQSKYDANYCDYSESEER